MDPYGEAREGCAMIDRHLDITGMTRDEIIAASADTLEEIFADMIDNAGKLIAEHGGTDGEVEAARELQRELLRRNKFRLRCWLERDGAPLH
jgi:hypothetical protein